MRGFLRLPSGSRFIWLATVVYLVARSASSWARPAAAFPDTAGYETLVFRGTNDRFWPVPLAFQLAQSAGARVAVHVIVGTIAWAWLATVLAKPSRYPRAIAAITLLIGLVPQVVRYDLAMLSESLGISLSVAAVAATIRIAREPSLSSRLAWFALVITCAMIRPSHLVVLAVCTVGALTACARSRGRRMAMASLMLASASAWGFTLLVGNGSTSELNLYTVLAERVITNDTRYSWFVEQGMPDIPAMRTAEGYDFAGDLPADLAAYVDLPTGQQPPALVRAGGLDLAKWVRSDGWPVFARWALTHPGDTWSHLSALAAPTLDPPNDDFLPLDSRAVVPRVLFTGWWLWAIAGVAALGAGLAQPGAGRTTRAIVAMSGTAALLWAGTLLSSGIEHQRHAATVAVLLRVLALSAIAGVTATGTRGGEEPSRFDDRPV